MKGKAAILVLSSLAGCAVPAYAWGCEGHQVVALVAWQFLTEHARSMTEMLQQQFPPDANLRHYCKGDEKLPVIAQVATWADDYRTEHPETAPWHYVNIPLEMPVGDGKAQCASGCITVAVTDQYAILRAAPGAVNEQSSTALRFVIHFLGDMHQPLHVEDNGDQGGNCVPVQYLGEKPKLEHGKYSPELHAVWDTNLVEAAMSEAKSKEVSDYAEHLAMLASQNRTEWSQGTRADWIAEGHALAQTVAYGELESSPPLANLAQAIAGPAGLEKCSDSHYDQSVLEKHLAITSQYVRDAGGKAETQLAKAGLRLANMLNAIWP